MIRNTILFTSLFLLCVTSLASANTKVDSFYDFSAVSLRHDKINFERYRGKVVLVTNIALKCGTTPQLKELQTLYEKYKDQGLVILGFPSNDFTGVEPKDGETIKKMCELDFGVTFPLFQLGHVRGDETQDVIKYVSHSGVRKMRGDIEFNFEKFLIGKDGKVKGRYGPFTGAGSDVLTKHIEKLLGESTGNEV